MNKYVAAAAAASLSFQAVPASAQQRVRFDPVAGEGAAVRYDRGIPTIDLRGQQGAVQVTPLGLDHGRLTFDVAVLNTGNQPANFGVEDMRAEAGGRSFAVLTREQLDKMARNRAMWAAIGTAVLTGAVVIAAASATDRYSYRTYTPRGVYRTVVHAPSAAGQMAAAGAVIGGSYTLGGIQAQLDATRRALAYEIVETTTVHPDESYAGRIVVDKLKNLKWPQVVTLSVRFNGEDYPFSFKVMKVY